MPEVAPFLPMSSQSPTTRHGWGNVLLDTVIAWLLPSVAGKVLRLALPEGAVLVGATLTFLLLAFYLIGRLRGRAGLAPHLAKVVALITALSLLASDVPFLDWLLGLPALIAAAALGGWTGSRGREKGD